MIPFYGAKWIWPEISQKKINSYCEFIKIIDIKKPQQADIYISANKDYCLWINGKFVSCGQYPDYPKRKSFDRIDITEFLREGKNKIAILAYNP
ncbi:MAG: alpha-L-rhamnosidase N-terminal domain-containing protein, partial [Armatimonadetes bacterium]|nr:alpha-L-rhamnosidase N-terminal domain-containing protein [Candidatus Hippobium faecium]